MALRILRVPTRRSATIWTANPEQAVWDHLKILQQPMAVAGILTGKSGSRNQEYVFSEELANSRAREISLLLVQAEEYYRASEVATLATRPLTLYYGMLSLAKSVILAWDKLTDLLDLKYHGLDTRPRSGDMRIYRETPDAWNISEEYASVNKGVFEKFANLYGIEKLQKGDVFTLDGILKTDSELSVAYNRMNGYSSSTFPLYSHTISVDPFKIILHPTTVSIDEFKSVFAFLEPDFEILPELYHDQAITVRSRAHLTAMPTYFGIEEHAVGGSYLIGPSVNREAPERSLHVPRPVTDLAGVFILSDLTRYRPQFWVDVARGDPRGNIGVISLYLAASRKRFAHEMLNSLFAERFVFGTGALLG